MDIDSVLHSTGALLTPFAVIDIDQARRNIADSAALAAAANLALYPHAKSHKTVALAREQIALGAAGLTCQTLGEAEIMVKAGPKEIVIPVPAVGRQRIQRLATLARRVRVTTVVGDAASARELERALRSVGAEVGVFLELDTGYHRCGLSLAAIKKLVGDLDGLSRLRLQGLLTYEGNVYDCADAAADCAADAYVQIAEAAEDLEDAGVRVGRISIGASAGRSVVFDHPRLTDARWGSLCLGDMTQVEVGSMLTDQCAYGVVAMVISQPGRGGFVIDVGAKSLSYTPSVKNQHYGHAVSATGIFPINRLADEQAMCDDVAHLPPVGSRVLVLPTAHAASIDCFGATYWIDDDGSHQVSVDARGAH
jgi:D-serine deaminase-like pyridoxal phosphate-dependent protein